MHDKCSRCAGERPLDTLRRKMESRPPARALKQVKNIATVANAYSIDLFHLSELLLNCAHVVECRREDIKRSPLNATESLAGNAKLALEHAVRMAFWLRFMSQEEALARYDIQVLG